MTLTLNIVLLATVVILFTTTDCRDKGRNEKKDAPVDKYSQKVYDGTIDYLLSSETANDLYLLLRANRGKLPAPLYKKGKECLMLAMGLEYDIVFLPDEVTSSSYKHFEESFSYLVVTALRCFCIYEQCVATVGNGTAPANATTTVRDQLLDYLSF